MSYLSGRPLTPPGQSTQDDQPAARPQFYTATFDGRAVRMTPAEYDHWQAEQRAAIEAARQRAAADAAERKQEADARNTAHFERIAAEDEANARRSARVHFAGTDAEFSRLWPDIWRQIRIDQTANAAARRQQEVNRRTRSMF